MELASPKPAAVIVREWGEMEARMEVDARGEEGTAGERKAVVIGYLTVRNVPPPSFLNYWSGNKSETSCSTASRQEVEEEVEIRKTLLDLPSHLRGVDIMSSRLSIRNFRYQLCFLTTLLLLTTHVVNGEGTDTTSNKNNGTNILVRSRRFSLSDDDNALRSSSCDAYGHRCVSGSTCIPSMDSSRGRYSDNTGYTCLCPPGLTGTYCQDDIDECLNNKCENGATCVNSHGSFSCVCVNGWTGPTCSINIDDCAAASCLNGATCHDKVGSFYCECPPGKTGLLCHMEDACASNPCQYGAYCDTSPFDGSYTCRCPKGFTGHDCSQDIDECRSNNLSVVTVRHPYFRRQEPEYDGPCEHKGTCVNTVGSFKCHCEPGFTGPRCEININECESNPCQNEGTCLDNPGHFTCVCMPGFSGTKCEHEIDECSSNPCQNGALCNDLINGYKCICPPGFTGSNCEENIDDCHSSPCQNGAECKDSLDSYICKCLPGFNGPRCETNIDECANNPCIHGTCIDGINKFECKCPVGYTGQLCHQEINDCLSSPCMYGGTCVDLNAANGTTRHPENNNDFRWSSNRHHQRAQLHYQLLDGHTKGYKCVCPPGTKGPRCEINVDDCWSNPCLNNATCTDLINGYRCNCLPGFTGPTCSLDIDECESSTSVCMNGATCINQTPGFKCICPPGYYGRTCTYDQDDCLSSPCLNDGVCRDHPGRGHYSCICPPAYTGQRCESRMESVSACNLNPCAHGATCIPSTGEEGFKCACRPGYTGERCEININECETNPCINGGTCLDGVNGFTCLCALPFSGPRCDMSLDPCLFNSCSGRSKCIPSPDLSNYTCLCEPGFQGKTCGDDVDECALGYLPGRSFRYRHRNEREILCLNGGTCMNVIGSFRCSCPRGFTGDRCEINVNECEVDAKHPGPICLNGGTCLDLDAKYQCLCRQGWTGSNCQIAVKACSSSPCENGATCQDATSRGFPSGSYQCSCPLGFSGKNCETNDDDCTSSSCLNGGTCLDGINSFTCKCPPGFSGSNCQEHDESVRYDSKRIVCRGFDIPVSSRNLWMAQNYRNNKDCEEVDPWSKCPDAPYCARRFGDGTCDKDCNNRLCFYDGNDCEPVPEERVCNELYDDYCIQNYANGRCDPGCNNRACNWDGMDCIDNPTIVSNSLPGSINITIDLPLGTMKSIDHKTLVAFVRELSNLVPGTVFEIKSKGRDETSGLGMLELGVNEAFCQNESFCFSKVTEIAEYMAALQSSSQVFNEPLPGSSLRVTSVKAVEEEEAGFPPSKTNPSMALIFGSCFALVVSLFVLGVLYSYSGAGGPMRSKKARGIVWFPEGFPVTSVGQSRRDGGAAKAAGGDFSRVRTAQDGQEMHSLSANLKGEIGQSHTLKRGMKGDKDSMETVEESIYDEPLEPRPWTVQHLEAFQGRSAAPDFSTTGQLLSPPLYAHCTGFPGSPDVGVDVRGPGGLTPLMVASAFDSQNLFCQQKILSASNLFPGSPSTLLRGDREPVNSPTRHAFSPDGGQVVNDLATVSSDVISELIQSGACLSKQSETGGETPLHLAARYSRADAAKRLLDAGAECNAVDFAGRTPLHAAIAADARGVFEILLRNRATDLEAQAYDGSTPLILTARLACEGMLEDLVVALNQPGALDAQDEAGRTALHWAASVNNVKAVDTLLQHGANRDSQDNKEETPLFLACREGAFQAAKLLLEQGANRDITDHMDRLPRDVAAERFHNDIVQLLDEVQPIVTGPGSHHLLNNVHSPPQSLQMHSHQPPLMVMSLPRKRRGSTSVNDNSSSSTQHLLTAESSSTMSSPPPTPSKPTSGQHVLTAVNHSRSQSTLSSAPKKRSAASRRASCANRAQNQQPSSQQIQSLHIPVTNNSSSAPPLLPLIPLSPHLVSSSATSNYSQGPLISTTSASTNNSNNMYSTSGLLLSPPSSSSPMSSSFSPSSHHTLSPPSHHNQHHQHQPTYLTSHYSQPPTNQTSSFMNHQAHRINNSSIPPPAYDEIQGMPNGNSMYDQVHTYYSSLQPMFIPSPQMVPSITASSTHEQSPYSYESNDPAAYLTPSPDSPENGNLYSPDPTRITDWTNVDMNPGSNISSSSASSSIVNSNHQNGSQTMSNHNRMNISSNPAPSQQSVFI